MGRTRIRLEWSAVAPAASVGILTIDRPEARNAIDRETIAEMREALQEVRERSDARCLLLTGGGDKVFVSGADVNTLLARSMNDVLEAGNNRLFREIEELSVPTIAAVNGFALGGGLELALACDLRFAASTAKMGLPETGLGILPGAGGTTRLPRLVGLGVAKDLVLTGRIVDAEEALRLGLVNRVVAPGELMTAAMETASVIAKRAPVAVRLAKMSLNAGASAPLGVGLDFEIVAQTVLNATTDKKEGMTAFLEKRAASYKGE